MGAPPGRAAGPARRRVFVLVVGGGRLVSRDAGSSPSAFASSVPRARLRTRLAYLASLSFARAFVRCAAEEGPAPEVRPRSSSAGKYAAFASSVSASVARTSASALFARAARSRWCSMTTSGYFAAAARRRGSSSVRHALELAAVPEQGLVPRRQDRRRRSGMGGRAGRPSAAAPVTTLPSSSNVIGAEAVPEPRPPRPPPRPPPRLRRGRHGDDGRPEK